MPTILADSHGNRPLMTDVQRQLLDNALTSEREGNSVTSVQRAALREICTRGEDLRQRPEQFLVEFKTCLLEAATRAGVPVGPDRSALIERFVSAFIEELYRTDSTTSASGDGARFGKRGTATTQQTNHDFFDAHP
jgi:hypothetical protein